MWREPFRILECHKFDAKVKTKCLVVVFPFAKGKFSIDTLHGEIIPVGTENMSLKMKTNQSYWTFDCSDYRDYDGRINNFEFWTESSYTNVKLSVDTLMGEMKLLDIEKQEFKYR